MAENPEGIPNPPNQIEDKEPKPKGVIPKNTQSLVIIGVAVLMILIMWLTGGGKKPVAPPRPALPPPPVVTPTDTTKVQDFKQTIQAEQQQAIRQPVPVPGAILNGAPAIPGGYNPYGTAPGQTATYPSGENSGPPNQYYGQPAEETSAPLPDPIKAEEKKRAYLSLFASNVALTYRKGVAAEKVAGSPADSSLASATPAGGPTSLYQAQALRDAEALAAMGPPLPWTQPPQQAAMPAKAASNDIQQPEKSDAKPVNPDVAQPGEFNSARGKKYVLFEGTAIDSVLMNRLNGSFSGPVNCLVTHDVYSHDRQHVLIPAGTKVLGEAQKVNAFGQQRLAVFFRRLIMPDGYSVNLDQFKGLDQLGATALHDKVNNHYAKIFGASLAVGILGGIGQAGPGPILTQSALDEARIGFGESMAMTGERIMDRFLNLMPTITIREGTRVKVYLSNDLLLPDYNQHTMPSDF
ncbi:MAG TPA: TrbI/VirB10 family protein [Terriglobia bacterium]|nr:TrbI/VirB10 family protein [Terriglobia bacterium]